MAFPKTATYRMGATGRFAAFALVPLLPVCRSSRGRSCSTGRATREARVRPPAGHRDAGGAGDGRVDGPAQPCHPRSPGARADRRRPRPRDRRSFSDGGTREVDIDGRAVQNYANNIAHRQRLAPSRLLGELMLCAALLLFGAGGLAWSREDA
jgi:hypothetical protein